MEKKRRTQKEQKETKINVKGIMGIIFKLLAIVFMVMTGIFFAELAGLNMLPTKYLIVVATLLLLFAAFIAFILCKKKAKIIIKVILSIIAVGVVVGYSYVINYMNATETFIEEMTTEVEETEDYYVITLKDSKYASVEKLEDINIHTFMSGEDFTDVKEDVLAKVKAYFKDDESLSELSTNLLNKKIYAILVSNSQYAMLKDENLDFESKTTVVHTSTHKIKRVEETLENEKQEKYTIQNGSFNVYISGIDTSGRISNVSRSDANIIATVNLDTHQVLLTSIPRDYYVTLYSKKKKDKLTHAGIYGIKETYRTVEELLDTDINYYVRVNFTTLEKLVDALGGIYVNSDYTFSSQGFQFYKGRNYLNGEEALAFSRERNAFAGGDRQRGINQQAVIKGIMDKAFSPSILSKYTKILKSLSGTFQTNISTDEISDIVKGQLDNMVGWNIASNSLDGKGSYATTYSGGSTQLYVMIPNESSVVNAMKKINQVLEAE